MLVDMSGLRVLVKVCSSTYASGAYPMIIIDVSETAALRLESITDVRLQRRAW